MSEKWGHSHTEFFRGSTDEKMKDGDLKGNTVINRKKSNVDFLLCTCVLIQKVMDGIIMFPSEVTVVTQNSKWRKFSYTERAGMQPHLFLPAASLCPAVPICFAISKKRDTDCSQNFLYCGRGFFAENTMGLTTKLIMFLFKMLVSLL